MDLDISMARMAHITLEMALEAMARGERTPEPDALPDQTLCELGIWLAQSEREAPTRYDTRYSLMIAHEQFHDQAKRVVTHLAAGHAPGSPHPLADEMAHMRLLSRDIVFLLTSVELEYLHEQHRNEWLAHPLKSLLHRLFDNQHLVLSGEENILDVSHARLAHLRWLQEMFKSFRNRGRHILLDSAESCPLGVWIQNVGLPKYARIAEMTLLNNAHQRFHTQADKSIKWLRKRQDIQAEQAYTEMQTASREILYGLSLIEITLLDEISLRRTQNRIRFSNRRVKK